MTLAEQTAIILYAGRCGFIQPPEAQQWVYLLIESMAQPPFWIIDIATTPFKFMDDIFVTLEAHAGTLSLRAKLQVSILRQRIQGFPLIDVLPWLFQAVFLEEQESRVVPQDEQLTDALVKWNLQDDRDVIPPELASQFYSTFDDYLANASEVASLLQRINYRRPNSSHF